MLVSLCCVCCYDNARLMYYFVRTFLSIHLHSFALTLGACSILPHENTEIGMSAALAMTTSARWFVML